VISSDPYANSPVRSKPRHGEKQFFIAVDKNIDYFGHRRKSGRRRAFHKLTSHPAGNRKGHQAGVPNSSSAKNNWEDECEFRLE
jgi:hypothetical protein